MPERRVECVGDYLSTCVPKGRRRAFPQHLALSVPARTRFGNLEEARSGYREGIVNGVVGAEFVTRVTGR